MAAYTTTCRYCGNTFEATRSDARFCSDSHRAQASVKARIDRGVADFRAGIGELLAGYADANDADTMQRLAADVAAFTPAGLSARRRAAAA